MWKGWWLFNWLEFTTRKSQTWGQKPTQLIGQCPFSGTWAIRRRKHIFWSSPFLWEKGSCLHLGTWSKCSIFHTSSFPCDWGALATGCLYALLLVLDMFCKDLNIENVFFSVKTYQCTRSCILVGTGPPLPKGRDYFSSVKSLTLGSIAQGLPNLNHF